MKNDILQKWFSGICSRRTMPFSHAVIVTGVRDEHRGPRWEFAKIEVSIQPANGFEVSYGRHAVKAEFLEAAVFGLMDILLTGYSIPVRDVKIELLKAEEHPVDSTEIAFREAGRDAGRKALEQIKGGLYAPPGVAQ